MKKCPCCLKVKPFNEFGMDRSRPDALCVYCRICQYAIARGGRNKVAMTKFKVAERMEARRLREQAVRDMQVTLAERGLL